MLLLFDANITAARQLLLYETAARSKCIFFFLWRKLDMTGEAPGLVPSSTKTNSGILSTTLCLHICTTSLSQLYTYSKWKCLWGKIIYCYILYNVQSHRHFHKEYWIRMKCLSLHIGLPLNSVMLCVLSHMF